MSKKIVEIFTEDGAVDKYRPLSERLPAFLEAYPPEHFRVVIEAKEMLSCRPGLLRLYELAIQAGKNPAEVGLPPVPYGAVVFTASCLDKEDHVIATASAYRFRVSEYKDWEKGETAARQRLLAALGFGGQVFDEDEIGDMADQGLCTTPTSSSDGGVASTPVTPAPASTTAPAKEAVLEEKPNPQPRAEVTADIPLAMLRQIEHQAKLKGKKIPSVNSLDEARKALKELLAA